MDHNTTLWIIGGLVSAAYGLLIIIVNNHTTAINDLANKTVKKEELAKVEADNKEIKENYNDKFDKTHKKLDINNQKLDKIIEMYSSLHEEQALQIQFCKLHQQYYNKLMEMVSK